MSGGVVKQTYIMIRFERQIRHIKMKVLPQKQANGCHDGGRQDAGERITKIFHRLATHQLTTVRDEMMMETDDDFCISRPFLFKS